MGRIKPAAWFFIVWFALQTLLGQWNYISRPPQGMHQGAQADRACVAWNYYHESMDFFKPRVMENRAADGVAGMEFPVLNYSAAICYKIFGPQEIWYRLVLFIIVTFGVFAAWLITGFFMQKLFFRLLLVMGWYISPVFVFYSANFIPDPAALSFSMIAWYYFIRFYFNIKIQNSLRNYAIFTTLAGLIKITFLISHFAIFALFILNRLRPNLFPQGFPVFKKAIVWFLIPFAPIAAWYSYSAWLTAKTGNVHFLQAINPAHSIKDFIENTRFGFNTWQESLYAPNYFYILAGLILFAVATKWRQSTLLGLITILLFVGFAASFVLFNNQYRYHDYYYLLLYPALFFGMLFIQQVYVEQKQIFIGIFPIAVFIGFFYFPISNFYHTKNMLVARYEEGNYYSQEAFTGIRAYTEFQKNTAKLIPEKSEIVSVFDPSPNTTLYFMRKKGIRIARDFNPELARDVMNSSKADYLVLNDSATWEKEYEPVVQTHKKLVYQSGNLSLWKMGR